MIDGSQAAPPVGGSASPQAAASAPDRAISPVAGGFGVGKTGKIATLAALLAGCAVFLMATWKHGPAKAPTGPIEPARQVVAYEPAQVDAKPVGAPPTLAHPGPGAPRLDLVAPSAADAMQVPAIEAGPGASTSPVTSSPQVVTPTRSARLQAVRSAPILAFSQTSPPPRPLGAPAVARVTQEGGATLELDQLRRSSTIGLARASRLPDRTYLITAGAAIPCTLQTAMDTSTPGYVSCLIGSDVYSDNGTVVLMEKGTKVLGEYRSGMRQGQRRLFVLWTRAVTPTGVAIGLASPAADALGRAGFDGVIDAHFWERFGGALLLSIVDDAAAAVASRTDSNGATARVPSDAAAVALQNSVNIPPSLIKMQGAQVAIFAAQDLDFSSVYGLKAR